MSGTRAATGGETPSPSGGLRGAALSVGAALGLTALFAVVGGAKVDPVGLLLGAVLQLAVAAPLALLARWRSDRRGAAGNLLLLVGLFVLEHAALGAPAPGFLTDLSFNWSGKLVALAVGLLTITLWDRLSFAGVGVTARTLPGSRRPVAIVVAGLLMAEVGLLVLFASGSGRSAGAEFFAYQATMPGLEEELWYRGIFLVLLNGAFGRPRTVAGARVGWGIVLQALLFGLVHGLVIGKDGGVIINLAAVTVTGGFGLLLGWLRARSGSLVPCVVLHNLANMLGALA